MTDTKASSSSSVGQKADSTGYVLEGGGSVFSQTLHRYVAVGTLNGVEGWIDGSGQFEKGAPPA